MAFLSPLLRAAVIGLFILSSALALPTSTNLEKRDLPISFRSTRPLTFYRAVTHPQEMNQMDHPHIVGSHPPPFPQIAGDFSAHGGYYMFASREEALYWGNSFAALSSGRKFMIVELTYHAQALVPSSSICSFPSGDINWQRFVRTNQAHPPPAPPTCPLVEGPLSRTTRDQYVPAISAITGQLMWQYAIVHPNWLSVVRISSVQQFNVVPNWHHNPHVIPSSFARAGNWARVCPGCQIQ
ncbi:hypothetical protein C8J55DRAFT_608027 [Lentinula edodes]|uniref:Uncharacterized protein n=1 Tax=Lentinula lateritia TaxID=40482 RepID=A0A9W9DHM0_9AGAR|nr:hypothetical protein C8J55DRAFT_608027 [Lentinula edodes]